MSRIALTGAGGRIGTSIRPLLEAQSHELVLCDSAAPEGEDADGRVVADLRDIDRHVEAFRGADLVVHLGALSDERPWPDLLAVNIDGTRAVCEATRLAGVRRLLLASSVHAAGFVPTDSAAAREGMPLPSPDTYYGVSKAALEALGALYAGRFGVTVVSARIMSFGAAPAGPGALRSWLSPGDMTRLVLATLTTTVPGHHVVWGVSRNSRRVVDLAPGRVIGYEPVDDAETYGPVVAQAEAAQDDPVTPEVLGGLFASDSYRLGEPHGGHRA